MLKERLYSWLGLLLLALSYLSGCSGGQKSEFDKWIEPNGKIKVLSTIAMIDDLVRQVGGERVDTLVLIKGELDPHSYQLVKGDDEKLAYADVVFYNGLGLEHGSSLQKTLQDNPHAIPLGTKVSEQFPNLILRYNGQPDPHIWMDISLWAKSVVHIVRALSGRDPAHSYLFKANGELLLQQMKNAHESVRSKLQNIPQEKRYLVTSHDAFNYFTRAYFAEESELQSNEWQQRFAAPEGLAPDSQLSPIHIQEILNHVSKYKVHVIFPETNVSKDSIRKILQAGREKGLELKIADQALYGDAMGREGSPGDSYLKMLQHNADTISRFLEEPKATKETVNNR